MVVRAAVYEYVAYERMLKKSKKNKSKEKLPMVNILVFYTGERPWNAANKLFIKSRLDINGCGMVGFIRIRGGA